MINISSERRSPSPGIRITGVLFNEDGRMLFISDGIRIFGYGTDRRLAWVREGLGGYDIEMESCLAGVLTIQLEEEMGETRKIIRLLAKDGSNG